MSLFNQLTYISAKKYDAARLINTFLSHSAMHAKLMLGGI